MKKRKWLSLLLAVMMLVSAVPFFPVTADAADGTVEVSTWAELKKALDYTTKCSVVKVVKDIETKSLNGHTGLHQDNIIFMTMAMDKVLDLNGHTVNAYAKYYSEVAQGYLHGFAGIVTFVSALLLFFLLDQLLSPLRRWLGRTTEGGDDARSA